MPDGAPRRARFSERNLPAVLVLILFSCTTAQAATPQPLPGTQPLTTEGDLASQMVDGIGHFLDRQTRLTAQHRNGAWHAALRDPDIRDKFLAEKRTRLAHILGLRDPRPSRVEMELLASTDQPSLVGKSPLFEAHAVRWPAFGDVHGEGLLLKPLGREPVADVIAIPDADQTPEMICGLDKATPRKMQFARRLAESGFRVIVPVLIDRQIRPRPAPGRTGGPELTSREYLYRPAFELGRHVIGYEIAKIQAAIDWCTAQGDGRKVGLFGYGEGGMLALYTAALDTRVNALGVSGYFGQREAMWKHPIDRNVFGLLTDFGDAELAILAAHADPVIETSPGPHFKQTGKGGAPGELADPTLAEAEYDRATELSVTIGNDGGKPVITAPAADAGPGSPDALRAFASRLGGSIKGENANPEPENLRSDFDPAARQLRQFHELDRHTQAVLAHSADVRQQFMKKLDTSSPEKLEQSAKPYREHLYRDILGRFDDPLLPASPRTRKVYDTDKYTGYEVVLDVFPDVFAYGVLLLPKDLKPGERRPVVVCQHGLEGRPKDVIEGDSHFYHAFAAKLCEQGFITFAPQNPYIFGGRFRTLVRKAYPLGKTLWSIIIPQHQQILNFLKALPNVDPKRIAFYGLSYGGKTAMRVPAVLPDYCLSICSGDFNEWVVKCSSSTLPMSYLFTNEYEMFEFDLGQTFNYAEMAALIAPRPFMVERGHFDGVSTDEWVAFEFAKVRRLYQGQLKLPPDRCQIEFFDGPHTIHGVGTFEFLHEHLNWEKPR